ncbi:MAG: hypothetical protein ABIE84_04525, partial [bacterium]
MSGPKIQRIIVDHRAVAEAFRRLGVSANLPGQIPCLATRRFLHVREMTDGVDTVVHREELEALAEFLTSGDQGGFYAFAAVTTLFRLNRDGFICRGSLLRVFPKREMSRDDWAHYQALMPTPFQEMVAEPDPLIVDCKRNFFQLYRHNFMLARALGESDLVAAQKALQFVDKLLLQVEPANNVEPANIKAKTRALIALAAQHSHHDAISVDYLVDRLADCIQQKRGEPADALNSLPLRKLLSIVQRFVNDSSLSGILPSLLSSLNGDLLFNLLGDYPERDRNGKGILFSALLLMPEKSQAVSRVIGCEVREAKGKWLADWVMRERKTEPFLVEELQLAVAYEGLAETGGASSFLDRAASAVMRHKGPEAFARWANAITYLAEQNPVYEPSLKAADADEYRQEAFLSGYDVWFGDRPELKHRFQNDLAWPMEYRGKERMVAEEIAQVPPKQRKYMMFALLGEQMSPVFYAAVAGHLSRLEPAEEKSNWFMLPLAMTADKNDRQRLVQAALLLAGSMEEIDEALSVLSFEEQFEIVFGRKFEGIYAAQGGEKGRLTEIRKAFVSRLGGERTASLFANNFLTSINPMRVYADGVLSIEEVRGIVSKTNVEAHLILFRQMTDEDVSHIFTPEEIVDLAGLLLAELRDSVGKRFNDPKQCTSPDLARLVRVYPPVAEEIMEIFAGMLRVPSRMVNVQTAQGWQIKGTYNPDNVLIVAQNVAHVAAAGVSEEAIKNVAQGLLVWLSIAYPRFSGQVINSPLARFLEIKDDFALNAILLRAEQRGGVATREYEPLAPNIYDALYALGGRVLPYTQEGIDVIWSRGLPAEIQIIADGIRFLYDLQTDVLRRSEDDLGLKHDYVTLLDDQEKTGELWRAA